MAPHEHINSDKEDENERARRSISLLEQHLEKHKKLKSHFKSQYELAEQYCADAKHYYNKKDYFTSFGCSDYAYGLLDAIAAVKENQYFPEPAVGAAIFNNKGELLLIKSHKWHDKYVIPGGHIELGEKMLTSLTREIKEETNLDIYDVRPIMIQELIYDPIFWKRRHFVFMDYACKAKNPEEIKLNEEGQDFLWVKIPTALKMTNIEPYSMKTIKSIAKKILRTSKKLGKK
jgi:nucleoside triphosphatase